MFEILNSYLFQHKSISIPGLGTIVMERVPANTDIGNKNFLPPLYHFRFDKYFDAPDKDFFSYLATEKNIPDYEAIKWYNEFSLELRNKIKLEEKVKWDDVGVLKKDYAGNIVFESVPGKFPFMEPVEAATVIRKDAQHLLRVGDSERTSGEMNEWLHPAEEVVKKQTWWIYAIALAAAAIIILLFHFSSKPMSPSSFGNQQQLETTR
ncbi:MAG: hypothetical protein JST87_09070 [Bacteroidetes bacterium]|nr:hypothetical protein [Bacteroidota bacterium]